MSVYRNPKTEIPLPPASAQRFKTVCHYCIVGCSYDVYKWPLGGGDGGPRAHENALGVDFTQQQPALAGTWIGPEQQTVVQERDGRRYNIVIIPNKKAKVNTGLSSVRGGSLATSLYAPDKPTAARLQYPLVYRARDLNPTSWDDAVDLVARVIKGSIDKDGPNSIYMKFFDHGGGGGGFENNWGVGKFFFTGIGTVMCSIHNRPAYNSEVHASRDMGVPELNNAYEDAELADTIVLWGANSYETQTNYYLNHMVPNLNGATLEKKQKAFGSEAVAKGRMIVADPRYTTTIDTARASAGSENVLHLWLKPGTDIVLLNAIGRVIYEKKWHDRAFIEARTEKFADYASEGLQTARPLDEFLAEAVHVTGVSRKDIETAAAWIAAPKKGGARPRTLFHYEKGMIWGLNNYANIGTIVSLALLTGNLGKPGVGCSRMGGHQEGYVRPGYAGPRPAIYIDSLLAEGQGRVFWVGGCNPTVATLNAERIRDVLEERGAIVKRALDDVHTGNTEDRVAAILQALDKGGLFIIAQDIYLTRTAERAHVVLPAAAWGESPITSVNGERRLRLYEQFQDPPGEAKPDWAIQAVVARRLQQLYAAEGKTALAARFEGFGWKNAEEVFLEGGRSFPPVKGEAGYTKPGPIENYRGVTYAMLREFGHDGVQTPVQHSGGKVTGTVRLFAGGEPFRTESGKATFKGFKWPGYPAEVKAQLDKYPYFFTNGRVNIAWQTMYNDQRVPFANERVPMAWLEIHPDDARTLAVESGDLVEVYNDYGTANAAAFVTRSVKPGVVFMQFAHPRGTSNSLTTPYVDPATTIPYYKGSGAGVRKIGSLPSLKGRMTWIPVIDTAGGPG
jgi:arsenite oxidase large subunit